MVSVIYICFIIRGNATYEGFRVFYRQYTTEEGHWSIQKLWSFYWIKVSQLRFIFVFYIYIYIIIYIYIYIYYIYYINNIIINNYNN